MSLYSGRMCAPSVNDLCSSILEGLVPHLPFIPIGDRVPLTSGGLVPLKTQNSTY